MCGIFVQMALLSALVALQLRFWNERSYRFQLFLGSSLKICVGINCILLELCLYVFNSNSFLSFVKISLIIIIIFYFPWNIWTFQLELQDKSCRCNNTLAVGRCWHVKMLLFLAVFDWATHGLLSRSLLMVALLFCAYCIRVCECDISAFLSWTNLPNMRSFCAMFWALLTLYLLSINRMQIEEYWSLYRPFLVNYNDRDVKSSVILNFEFRIFEKYGIVLDVGRGH